MTMEAGISITPSGESSSGEIVTITGVETKSAKSAQINYTSVLVNMSHSMEGLRGYPDLVGVFVRGWQ